MLNCSDIISKLQSIILKSAESLSQQNCDVMGQSLGSFNHYMDLLEKVTFVNHSWDCDEKLYQAIKEIQQNNFTICHNLGSGKIIPKEENRLVEIFNVKDVFNVDVKPLDAVDLVCDITNLPFSDESIELTYNSSVLEHLPDPYAAVGENYRILKRGGYAYFWVPFMWREHDADLWRFTKSGLKLVLEKGGFRIIDIFTTQSGFGNCLSATAVQSIIPDYNKDFTNTKANYRKLLFLLIYDYAQHNAPSVSDGFYCGICAICRK